jgi:hypothetical protein
VTLNQSAFRQITIVGIINWIFGIARRFEIDGQKACLMKWQSDLSGDVKRTLARQSRVKAAWTMK